MTATVSDYLANNAFLLAFYILPNYATGGLVGVPKNKENERFNVVCSRWL